MVADVLAAVFIIFLPGSAASRPVPQRGIPAGAAGRIVATGILGCSHGNVIGEAALAWISPPATALRLESVGVIDVEPESRFSPVLGIEPQPSAAAAERTQTSVPPRNASVR